jgi:dienelactone hydrolase
VRTQDIEYTADGIQMIGYLAVDDTQPGRRPSVLVCHGGPGLDEHARGTAERLAALLYGGAMHSFTDPHAADLGMPGIVYHAPSDARSWRAMLDFFEEKLLPV